VSDDPLNLTPTTVYTNLTLTDNTNVFEVNEGVAVTMTADGKYAFVAGRNSKKILEPNANPLAGGNIGIIKDPLGPNPKLVAATEPVPGVFTNNVTLSGDGKYLIGSYLNLDGSGNAYAYNVGEIIKTVEYPGGSDLTKVPLNKLAPEIVSNIFATGGNSLGLLVASPKPPMKKLSQSQVNALTKVIHDLLDFFRPLGEFVAGAVYQWLHDNGDFGRWLLQIFIPGWDGVDKDVEKGLPQTWPFKAGRTFGDGTALVTGILEMIGGSGAAAGGGLLCVTGFGCIEGAPAIAAGVAIGLHGVSTVSSGAINIAKQLGVLYSQGTGGTGSQLYQRMTKPELEKARGSYQDLIREHEKKLNDYTANPDAYDNEGILKNAPNPEIRQKIIQGRRGALEKQIKKQRGELNKIEQELNSRP
jgi:hypothetical protein